MAKISHAPKVMTANRLCDGEVIYLTANGQWSNSFAESLIATDESHLRALLESTAHSNDVVEPVVITTSGDDRKEPASLREKIRLRGPTVRPDLARNS